MGARVFLWFLCARAFPARASSSHDALPAACTERTPWLGASNASRTRSVVDALSRGEPCERCAIVATPAKGKGGVGNSLRSMVAALHLAAISNRALLICWARPSAHVGEMLRPRGAFGAVDARWPSREECDAWTRRAEPLPCKAAWYAGGDGGKSTYR